MDLLLTAGYYIAEDAHEQQIMKPYPALGILYISAHLKARGFAVEVRDNTFETKESFRQYIATARPPVVGIYTNMMTKLNVLPMIRWCKEAGSLVVLGGPEPPHYAEQYLDHGADVIVLGEGEGTLEELIPHLRTEGPHRLEDIAGLVYRDEHGATVRTGPRAQIKNLDAQPFPDRAAIPLHRYLETWRTHHGRGSVSLITARGCPYTCTWCSHTVFGDSHRRQSPERTVAEVEGIIEQYQPEQLWYADDVFNISHKWLYRYVALMKERGIRLPFECICRADRMNEEVVDALVSLGCTRIWIGAESGSQTVLDMMKRRVKVEQVQAMTRLAAAKGIETGMFIMLGYDEERVVDLEETVDHLKKAAPDVFLTTVAYPIKGTPYYQKVADRIIADKPWDQRTDRDLSVAGRHSRRFYSFATRWMVNEVAVHRMLHGRPAGPVKLAKAFVNAQVGRAGMALTASEVETAAAGRGQYG
ncbi:MAG TPA: radical SAM protein [Chloroflexia bacterium]|nr:radical SAM protein [Chloroflexia bacterium]